MTELSVSPSRSLMHIAPGRNGMIDMQPNGNPLASVDAKPASSEVSQPSCDRVLIVEPDRLVRAAMTHALDELGYRYLEAVDPREAIALLQSPLEIKVLICDMDLPSLSGRRLAQIALARRPGLRVLLVVGELSLQTAWVPVEGIQTLVRSFTLPAFVQAVQG